MVEVLRVLGGHAPPLLLHLAATTHGSNQLGLQQQAVCLGRPMLECDSHLTTHILLFAVRGLVNRASQWYAAITVGSGQ